MTDPTIIQASLEKIRNAANAGKLRPDNAAPEGDDLGDEFWGAAKPLRTQPTIHNVTQGSEEWLALRTGLITASEMGLILTPTLKQADNENTRKHVYEIAAQRINKYTEPTYIGDNMLRGHHDEVIARALYSEHYEPVDEAGFITRDHAGVTVGYSPDGVCILSNGGFECKSRVQKYQVQTVTDNDVPKEHILQCQTALFVTGWDWIDYVSYSGGMPLWVIRVTPDPAYQAAIGDAVVAFDAKVQAVIAAYHARIDGVKRIDTVRTEATDWGDGEYK